MKFKLQGTTATLLIENMTLRQRLDRVAELIRTVYEDSAADNDRKDFVQLAAENKSLRELLQIAQVADSSSWPKAASTEHNMPPVNSQQRSQSGVVEEYFNATKQDE